MQGKENIKEKQKEIKSEEKKKKRLKVNKLFLYIFLKLISIIFFHYIKTKGYVWFPKNTKERKKI